MRTRSETKRSRAGFTLIELLAVIAIIGILASIVVPNVARYIARAKVTKAISEIKNADTALIGALSDTGRSSFRDFLTNSARGQLDNWSQQIRDGNFTAVREAGDFYNNFFYELLRQGRDSEFIIANVVPEVRQKLGTSYIDLGTDSWGNQYQFWMGSLRQGSMILRSFRVRDDAEAIDLDDPSFTSFDAYIYNQARRSEEQAQLPGQPKRDDVTLRFEYEAMFPNIQAYGFPAPKDQPVYMWSIGPNFINDAHLLFQMNLDVDLDAPEFLGGGDDPNNWDNASGWEDAPR